MVENVIVRPESSFTSRWRPCFLCLGNRFRATWRPPPGQRSLFHVSWVVFAPSLFLGQTHSHSSLFGGSRSGGSDFVTRMQLDVIMLFIFELFLLRKNRKKGDNGLVRGHRVQVSSAADNVEDDLLQHRLAIFSALGCEGVLVHPSVWGPRLLGPGFSSQGD